ncbi:MAG: Hsp20/alpha crystallin family protein [Acidisphaera sp.]|nr:Hsp20/alpha crystallin family protein [Acidisphaera sp.]
MARNPLTFGSGGLMSPGYTDPFMSLHREMNRLFDDVMRGGVASGGQAGGQAGGYGGAVLVPHMDVSETDKEVQVQLEMPGVEEKDVEVSLNEDVLTIRAEKRQEQKQEKHDFHFTERSYGTFQRSLRLPFPIEAEQVQAHFRNGVLQVTLPKAQPQDRSRRIQVKAGAPTIAGTSTPGGAERPQAGGASGAPRS